MRNRHSQRQHAPSAAVAVAVMRPSGVLAPLMLLLLAALCALLISVTALASEPTRHAAIDSAPVLLAADLEAPDLDWSEPNPEPLLAARRIIVADIARVGFCCSDVLAADAEFAHRPPARASPQHS